MVTNWVPIAGTTYAYARVSVTTGDEAHAVTADTGVGAYLQASKGQSLLWFAIGVRGIPISGE